MGRPRRKSARVPINEVGDVLFSDGKVLRDYFLVNGMVHCWGESIDGREIDFIHIIEEDALAEACEIYHAKAWGKRIRIRGLGARDATQLMPPTFCIHNPQPKVQVFLWLHSPALSSALSSLASAS
jgi:hypothetical protein